MDGTKWDVFETWCRCKQAVLFQQNFDSKQKNCTNIFLGCNKNFGDGGFFRNGWQLEAQKFFYALSRVKCNLNCYKLGATTRSDESLRLEVLLHTVQRRVPLFSFCVFLLRPVVHFSDNLGQLINVSPTFRADSQHQRGIIGIPDELSKSFSILLGARQINLVADNDVRPPGKSRLVEFQLPP